MNFNSLAAKLAVAVAASVGSVVAVLAVDSAANLSQGRAVTARTFFTQFGPGLPVLAAGMFAMFCVLLFRRRVRSGRRRAVPAAVALFGGVGRPLTPRATAGRPRLARR